MPTVFKMVADCPTHGDQDIRAAIHNGMDTFGRLADAQDDRQGHTVRARAAPSGSGCIGGGAGMAAPPEPLCAI